MEMATSSMIGYLNADGTVVASYCAYDGYLSGIGYELTTHFKTDIKAAALAVSGDIKSIDNGKVTRISGGDRADTFKNVNDFVSHALNQNQWNYVYLFANKKWHYQTATDSTFYQVVLKPMAA
jgi:hypothetical protein